ncbi:ABC-F family ATP-binding cassette domain-containing protein [Candidatus Babeliales bacterium]|nr:ABC-F family ATP-binding cassette domain-containing protein [Candidatus Babeliales bacterium]
MLSAKDVSLGFGQQIIFDNISFNINKGQRIGLVGRNGSGKTTLLNVIGGNHDIDSGKILLQKDCKIAYMPQHVVLMSTQSVLNEALEAFDDLVKIKKELCTIEKSFDVERYSILQQKLLDLDYERKLAEAKKVLLGLGFEQNQFEKSVETLSVGWKMRLVLAKLLLQKADFYLFDEPTNHLDLVAKDWFLNFLKDSDFGFVLVCHDKYFLDHLCDYIFEVALGMLNVYRGNYSEYLKQKEERNRLLEKKYIEQQKFIKKQQKVVERFRAKATKAKMVQSIIKSLQKIEPVRFGKKQKIVKFNFSNIKRSGRVVLNVKDLAFSFDSKQIFKEVNFEIERGQKVAIIAPNGTGKTTLLDVICGKYKLKSGSVELGYNVETVIFEQDQNRSLNLDNDILNEVENSCSSSEQRCRVRSVLGAFLFEGDDVYKKINVLSGGEKNRVAMVKVLLQDANFLILDEPTNHLDLESKEVLLNVLKQFTGTILFVSHDRDFLNELSTHILELRPNGIFKYCGNYDSFLLQKLEQEKPVKKQPQKLKKGQKESNKKTNKQLYEYRKKIRNIETRIEKIEIEISIFSEKLASLRYGTKEYDDVYSKIKILKKEIEEKFKMWEKLND